MKRTKVVFVGRGKLNRKSRQKGADLSTEWFSMGGEKRETSSD